MNLCWLMDLWITEQKCLEYHYTKLCRQTFFGQWTPHYQSRDALNTSTQNLAEEPTLADGPLDNRAEMPWILVHKTWQINLLWLMDPLGNRAEMPWIPVHKIWQMNLCWLMDLWITEQKCLVYHYTKLCRQTFFGQWTPHYQSRDALNTSTQNLAEEPTLADGPLDNRAEMPWILVHKTWQINLLWLMDPLGNRVEMPWIPVHKIWQMNLHCYWHLVVKNGNFTLLLTSSGQEW